MISSGVLSIVDRLHGCWLKKWRERGITVYRTPAIEILEEYVIWRQHLAKFMICFVGKPILSGLYLRGRIK
jgi:hypothetical protein